MRVVPTTAIELAVTFPPAGDLAVKRGVPVLGWTQPLTSASWTHNAVSAAGSPAVSFHQI